MADPPRIAALREQLINIPFFSGLEGQVIQELAQGAIWREYAAGEVVMLEGDAPRGLYYLQSGWLKITKMSAEGREQVLQILEPGETFNAVGVFANRPDPATAIALEPVGLWILRRDAVMELLARRPELAQQVIQKMANRVLELVELVEDLSLRTVMGRLARLLVEDAKPGPSGDVLRRPRWYTQAEIAARLGTVPDVVQRALTSLAASGLIEVRRDMIHILDRDALQALAN